MDLEETHPSNKLCYYMLIHLLIYADMHNTEYDMYNYLSIQSQRSHAIV
jgi:hypothetical protein